MPKRAYKEKKMKKLIMLLACACTALIITGCGKKPDAVVLDYMKTMQEGKLDEAWVKENCTEETAKLLNAMLALGKDEITKEMKEKLEGVTFTVTDTKIDGDTAVVTVKTEGGKNKDKGKEEEKINLKKVDGKWKIHETKEEGKDKKEEKPPKKS